MEDTPFDMERVLAAIERGSKLIDEAISTGDRQKLIRTVENYAAENPDPPTTFYSGPGTIMVNGTPVSSPAPEHITPEWRLGMMFYNVGNGCRNQGKHELAIDMYQEAINRGYIYPSVYNNMAGTQKELGRYIDALQSYAKALELEPQYLIGYLRMASMIVTYTDIPQNDAADLVVKFFARGGTIEILQEFTMGRPTHEERETFLQFLKSTFQ